MFTTNLVNLYNRNIFKTSLYIYIFQGEKCRLMRNLSLSMIDPKCLIRNNIKSKKINDCMQSSTIFVFLISPNKI